MTDPSHRHGHDPESLMDWRKALPPNGWDPARETADEVLEEYRNIDPVGAEAFAKRYAEIEPPQARCNKWIPEPGKGIRCVFPEGHDCAHLFTWMPS
jgi:hypothetical protein